MVRKSKPAPMVPYVAHYNVTYGWHLFPARVEKDIDGKFKKSSWLSKEHAPEHLAWGMSADPVQLEKNFTNPRYCHKCSIGLPTGEINNLFVIEADTKEGHGVDGVTSLEVLVEKYGLLPKTLMARSPSGSLHFYFNHPSQKVWNSASKIAQGVDVRGDGGMVITPPSVREDGIYEWHNDEEIADAPDWLIAMVTVSTTDTMRTFVHSAAGAESEGGIDPYLELAREQIVPEPINVDELLDDMEYGRNVHDTEVKLTASLLAKGEPVDVVIDIVLDEVRSRIESEGLKWNWNAERNKLRDMCASWLRKKPDVLEMQEIIPDWLAKKLNGNGRVHIDDEPAKTTPPPEPPKPALPWPEMDADALYGLTGEVVRMIEPHTEADANAILIQFLAYFGNAAGRDHYYPVERSRHHGNLFVVLAGDTSKARKGTSADWLRDLMKTVASDWSQCVKGGLSSGEGMIWDIRDDAETKDAQGNIIIGMARDKRRLFDEREFSRVLAMMKREGNVLSHVIRDAWDGRTLSIITKNNPIRCTGPHISICGHITSDELRRDLDNTSMANGYANRFLFACVKRSKELPFGSVIAPSALEAMAFKISKRIEKIWLVEKAIVMDQKARELWANAYSELSAAKDGLVGAITARAEAQTVRLALIYALLDGSDEIHVPHLKAALAVWKYCEASARYIFGQSLGDGVIDQVLEYLRDAGKIGMTRTEIYNAFGRNLNASRIATALMHLKKYGYAISTRKTQKGRPTETWYCT